MLRIIASEQSEQEALKLDLDALVREGARRMLLAALEAEVDQYIADHAEHRDAAGHALVVRISKRSGMPNRGPAQGDDTAPQPASVEMVATSERFFGHGLLPITLYQPDIAALQAASTRVVAAAGTASEGQFAQRTVAALPGSFEPWPGRTLLER